MTPVSEVCGVISLSPNHRRTRTSLIPMASLSLTKVPSLAGKKSGFKRSPCQLCDFGPEPSLLSVLVWSSKMGIQLNDHSQIPSTLLALNPCWVQRPPPRLLALRSKLSLLFPGYFQNPPSLHNCILPCSHPGTAPPPSSPTI